jgi:enolase
MKIVDVLGRRVWDSRGRPTVETEITLEDGSKGRAIAPAGASRGSFEALELRDAGAAFGGQDVQQAVAHVNGDIAACLRGQDALDQSAIDRAMIELDGTVNKSRLGANAIVATSLANIWACAQSAGMPLWQYLAGDGPVRLPLPEIQIFGGGAHAARRTDIQDFMVMSLSAKSFAEALDQTAEVYRCAGQLMAEANLLAGTADEGGWWPNFNGNEQALDMLVRSIEGAGFSPGKDMGISLDLAASEFCVDGKYRLALDDAELDRDAWLERLLGWIDTYPIVSIEDPVVEDDVEGMVHITKAIGDSVQIIGDDFLVTNPDRVRAAVADQSCNATLIKVNQIGTVSEAKEALDLSADAGWGTVVSARSGETEDLSIVHLSIGWNAGQLKVGSFARSERMAKWNEVLRIEEALGKEAIYAGASVLPGRGSA